MRKRLYSSTRRDHARGEGIKGGGGAGDKPTFALFFPVGTDGGKTPSRRVARSELIGGTARGTRATMEEAFLFWRIYFLNDVGGKLLNLISSKLYYFLSNIYIYIYLAHATMKVSVFV